MDDKLLEKTVLFSSLNLQFLDFVDEMYEKEDFNTINCVNSFFERKSFSYESIKSCKIFSCLPTSLGLLTSVIFYIRIESFINESIQIEDCVKIKYLENNTEKSFRTETILRVIRNSIAHNSENGDTNIFTENDEIIFQQKYNSTTYRVEFDINSFHHFIMWLIKTSREIAKNNCT